MLKKGSYNVKKTSEKDKTKETESYNVKETFKKDKTEERKKKTKKEKKRSKRKRKKSKRKKRKWNSKRNKKLEILMKRNHQNTAKNLTLKTLPQTKDG